MLRNAIALVEMEESGGAFGSFGSFARGPTSAAAGKFNAISRKSIVPLIEFHKDTPYYTFDCGLKT